MGVLKSLKCVCVIWTKVQIVAKLDCSALTFRLAPLQLYNSFNSEILLDIFEKLKFAFFFLPSKIFVRFFQTDKICFDIKLKLPDEYTAVKCTKVALL